MPEPEAWLRGPVDNVPTALQPVAHALVQALEDAEHATKDADPALLWTRPGGAASAGFHLRHMTGSLDRLFTYARGASLSPTQRVALVAEHTDMPAVSAEQLLADLRDAITHALDQLRATPAESLDDPREVGRARLPSSVRGLLHHAGEHTARHAGQVITTMRVVRGSGNAT